MHKLKTLFIIAGLSYLLTGAACFSSPNYSAKSSPAHENASKQIQPLKAKNISIAGPSCPSNSFQRNPRIQKKLKISPDGLLTIRLGSSPSIPCWWRSPKINDHSVVRQVNHRSKWPAEGITPKPGASGTEIWIFEGLNEGKTNIIYKCTCLGDKGVGREINGIFILHLNVIN